jgi:hypothetical protein
MAGGGAKVTVEEVRKAQRASGPATVLAIGTATPANCVYQADYPDYYFKITKSDHLTDLKEKFKRMCEYYTDPFFSSPSGRLTPILKLHRPARLTRGLLACT